MNDTVTTLIYSHAECLAHDPGPGHPESPRRLQAIHNLFEDYTDAPPGTDAQVLLAHEPAMLELIKNSVPVQGLAQLDADTLLSPGSLKAAYRGTGAACQGIDELISGSARHVFCAVRPPGHHATHNRAMGFCLFNHIAIAALYAQQTYGLDRIAIVDFDVHHGNGTQDIVQGRQGLFYISTHQSPLYPGSGHESENMPGNILNVPLASGTGHTAYQQIFTARVLPALEDFQPQLLLVSAGFDAHHADPLAGLSLSELTYEWLGRQLGAIALDHCNGRMLSVLEGGYNIEALERSVDSYLRGAERGLASSV